MIATSVFLAQYHVHHWIGQGITNAEDPVVVCIAQPKELTPTHWRNSLYSMPEPDLFVRTEYWKSSCPLPGRVQGNGVFGQGELVYVEVVNTLECQYPQPASCVHLDPAAAIPPTPNGEFVPDHPIGGLSAGQCVQSIPEHQPPNIGYYELVLPRCDAPRGVNPLPVSEIVLKGREKETPVSVGGLVAIGPGI